MDEVHGDMRARFDAAEQIALRLRREALAKVAGKEAAWSYREEAAADQTAVNLLPWKRHGVVRILVPPELESARSLRAAGAAGDLPAQIVDEENGRAVLVATSAPGFGASSVVLRRGRATVRGARLIGARALENEFYTVEVAPDGTIDLLHKPTGRALHGAHWFEDDGDRGDEYNFCPVEEDVHWDSRAEKVRVRRGMAGPAVASLVVEMTARLPEGLRPDRRARRRAAVPCGVRVEIRLAAGVDRVEFVTAVDNRAKDHRLRVLCMGNRQCRPPGHGAAGPRIIPTWADLPRYFELPPSRR